MPALTPEQVQALLRAGASAAGGAAGGLLPSRYQPPEPNLRGDLSSVDPQAILSQTLARNEAVARTELEQQFLTPGAPDDITDPNIPTEMGGYGPALNPRLPLPLGIGTILEGWWNRLSGGGEPDERGERTFNVKQMGKAVEAGALEQARSLHGFAGRIQRLLDPENSLTVEQAMHENRSALAMRYPEAYDRYRTAAFGDAKLHPESKLFPHLREELVGQLEGEFKPTLAYGRADLEEDMRAGFALEIANFANEWRDFNLETVFKNLCTDPQCEADIGAHQHRILKGDDFFPASREGRLPTTGMEDASADRVAVDALFHSGRAEREYIGPAVPFERAEFSEEEKEKFKELVERGRALFGKDFDDHDTRLSMVLTVAAPNQFEGIAQGVAELAKRRGYTPLQHDTLLEYASDPQALLESLSSQLPNLVMMMGTAGGKWGTALVGAAMIAMESQRDYESFTQGGADPGTAQWASLMTGTLKTIIELAQFKGLSKLWKRSLTGPAPGVSYPMQRILATVGAVGKEATSQTTEEVLQQAVDVVAAQVFTDADFDAEQAVSDAGRAAIDSFAMTLAFMVGGSFQRQTQLALEADHKAYYPGLSEWRGRRREGGFADFLPTPDPDAKGAGDTEGDALRSAEDIAGERTTFAAPDETEGLGAPPDDLAVGTGAAEAEAGGKVRATSPRVLISEVQALKSRIRKWAQGAREGFAAGRKEGRVEGQKAATEREQKAAEKSGRRDMAAEKKALQTEKVDELARHLPTKERAALMRALKNLNPDRPATVRKFEQLLDNAIERYDHRLATAEHDKALRDIGNSHNLSPALKAKLDEIREGHARHKPRAEMVPVAEIPQSLQADFIADLDVDENGEVDVGKLVARRALRLSEETAIEIGDEGDSVLAIPKRVREKAIDDLRRREVKALSDMTADEVRNIAKAIESVAKQQAIKNDLKEMERRRTIQTAVEEFLEKHKLPTGARAVGKITDTLYRMFQNTADTNIMGELLGGRDSVVYKILAGNFNDLGGAGDTAIAFNLRETDSMDVMLAALGAKLGISNVHQFLRRNSRSYNTKHDTYVRRAIRKLVRGEAGPVLDEETIEFGQDEAIYTEGDKNSRSHKVYKRKGKAPRVNLNLTLTEAADLVGSFSDSDTNQLILRGVPIQLDPNNPSVLKEDSGDARPIQFTAKGIAKLVDMLNTRWRGTGAELLNYMKHRKNGEIAAEANKTSVDHDGFELMTRPDHWGRRRNLSYFGQEVDTGLVTRGDVPQVSKQSVLQPRQGGNTPIRAGDALDRFSQDTRDIFNYIAFRGPMQAVSDFIGDADVKNTLIGKYGEKAYRRLKRNLVALDPTARNAGAEDGAYEFINWLVNQGYRSVLPFNIMIPFYQRISTTQYLLDDDVTMALFLRAEAAAKVPGSMKREMDWLRKYVPSVEARVRGNFKTVLDYGSRDLEMSNQHGMSPSDVTMYPSKQLDLKAVSIGGTLARMIVDADPANAGLLQSDPDAYYKKAGEVFRRLENLQPIFSNRDTMLPPGRLAGKRGSALWRLAYMFGSMRSRNLQAIYRAAIRHDQAKTAAVQDAQRAADAAGRGEISQAEADAAQRQARLLVAQADQKLTGSLAVVGVAGGGLYTMLRVLGRRLRGGAKEETYGTFGEEWLRGTVTSLLSNMPILGPAANPVAVGIMRLKQGLRVFGGRDARSIRLDMPIFDDFFQDLGTVLYTVAGEAPSSGETMDSLMGVIGIITGTPIQSAARLRHYFQSKDEGPPRRPNRPERPAHPTRPSRR